MTSTSDLRLQSLNRFHSPWLSVTEDLLGKSISFQISGSSVTIAIPNVEEIEREGREGRLRLHAWRNFEGKQIDQEYWVDSVDIVVNVPGTWSLPSEILERPPNRFDILTTQQQESLSAAASGHRAVAVHAYDRFVRTLRWKMGSARICREEQQSNDSGRGTTLIDTESKRRVWVQHEPLVVLHVEAVGPACWEQVESALVAQLEPPVFVDLFLDAQMHFMAGDLRRAVVDAAAAAEIFIRTVVRDGLPASLSEQVRDLVDEANIRRVMTKVFPDSASRGGLQALSKGITSDLHQLFDVRNKVLHMGSQDVLDASNCKKYLKAVRELIESCIGEHGSNSAKI